MFDNVTHSDGIEVTFIQLGYLEITHLQVLPKFLSGRLYSRGIEINSRTPPAKLGHPGQDTPIAGADIK